MNASECLKVKHHKKSRSVDFKRMQVSSNVDKFNKLINNKNISNITINKKETKPKYNKTSTILNKTKIFGNTTNKDFYKTFRKTSTNIHLNEFKKRFILESTQMPFESYRDSTKDIMSEYHYEALSKKPLDISDKKLLIGDDGFQKIKNKLEKKSFISDLDAISSGAKVKIFINDEEYKSPIKSFSVIFKNKVIHENVTKNNYWRQKDKYDDFLNKAYEFEKLANNKYRKIKITAVTPNKNDDNLSPKSPTDNMLGTPTDSNLKVNTPFTISEQKLIDLNLNKSSVDLYGYYVYPNKTFPEGREQFSLSYDGTFALVYGGLISNKSNLIWKLDPLNLSWNKEDQDFSTSIVSRFGHTANLYQKRLYVFGGRTKLNNFFYITDLEIYSLEDKTWFSPILYTKNTLKLRRNHISLLVGNEIFYHGGISEDEEYLNDSYCLSVNPLKWHSLPIINEFMSPSLAFHSACLVLPNELVNHSKMNILKFPDLGISRRVNNKIKEKGIYFFGGRNGDDGSLSNDIWILKIGKKPLEWIKPKINGKPPSPRYSQTMNFYESGNFLIVHGGRNDFSSECFALNDTYLLELWKMEWREVKIFFDSPRIKIYNRCGHASMVYTNKLIVFGGMNNYNYIGSSIFLIDLDSHLKPKSYYLRDVKDMKIDDFIILKKRGLKNSVDDSHKNQKSHEKHGTKQRPISILNSNPVLPPIK